MCSFGHALFGEVLVWDWPVGRHVWWGLLFSAHAVCHFIRMRGRTSSPFGASNSRKLPCLNVDMGITAPHQTGCQRSWLCSMYEWSQSSTIQQIWSRLYKGYVWHAKLFMDPTDQVLQWDQLVDPTSDFIVYPPDGTERHHHPLVLRWTEWHTHSWTILWLWTMPCWSLSHSHPTLWIHRHQWRLLYRQLTGSSHQPHGRSFQGCPHLLNHSHLPKITCLSKIPCLSIPHPKMSWLCSVLKRSVWVRGPFIY